MNPVDRCEVKGGRWEGCGKMRHRKELFSLHSACTNFPAVILVFHGEGVGFRFTKLQIILHSVFYCSHFRPHLFDESYHPPFC